MNQPANFFSRISTFYLLAFCLMALPSSVKSQWTYTSSYTANGGNPGELNAESDAPGQGSWTTIMGGAQGANAWSPATEIPFTFSFYGNVVTHFKASQNGLVTFDTATVLLPNLNENLPSANLPDSVICAFWDAFTATPPTGSGDDIRTNTFGTAPNRQFWIKWYSFEMGDPTVSFNYFAVVLEETSNKIYIVDLYSDGSSALSATVGVQLDNATAHQEGNNTTTNSGNGSAATDNDYYTFCPFLIAPDNAGVTALINPQFPTASGIKNLEVELTNFGLNDLNSVTVQWTLNGLSPPAFHYPGILPPGMNTSVPLGSVDLQGLIMLKAWTEMPNGVPDNFPGNDTLSMLLCPGLSGTYTVGGVGPDFGTFSEAVEALIQCGVTGPVVFDVAAGAYNGGISIPPIDGASTTNTITFDGGDASLTTVSHEGGSGTLGVFQLEGADHITITNLTLENTAVTNGWGVWLGDTADYNTIQNCHILLDPMGTINLIGIVGSGSAGNDFSEGNACNHLLVENCVISGGEMGMHFEGITSPTASWMRSIRLYNNTMSGMDDYGIYLDNQDSIEIIGNRITDLRNTNGRGIYAFDMQNFRINSNLVNAGDYGIYVSDGNFDTPVPVGRAELFNNMVKSEFDDAIYLDDINNIDLFHNTCSGNSGIRINDFTGLDMRNNIFVSEEGYAFESDESVGLEVVNFNVYFTSEGNALFIKDGPVIAADLPIWQAAVPALNSNSLEGNPYFLSDQDLHLVGIIANDVGDNSVGINTDIDGEMRPMNPSITVDIGADEYNPLQNDVLVSEIFTDSICGDPASNIRVVVTSHGQDPLASVPVTIELSGLLNQTVSQNFVTNLNFAMKDTFDFGPFDTQVGGSIDVLAYTDLGSDEVRENDTAAVSLILSSAVAPSVNIQSVDCVTSMYELTANAAFASISWWDAPVGGNLIATGSPLMVHATSSDTTLYAALGGLPPDTLSTTFAGGNGCAGGNMFDLTATKASLFIDSFTISPNAAIGVNTPVSIYYIPNDSYVGNETNMAAWTLLGSTLVASQGDGVPVTISVGSLFVPVGATYAFYVNADVNYTNGAMVFTDDFLSLDLGVGLCAFFGAINNNRTFNGSIVYSFASCTSDRTAISLSSTVPADNTWVGPSVGNWNDNGANWSKGVIPLSCDHVIIPNGKQVSILGGESAICNTIDVQTGGELITQATAVFTVLSPD